jgi:hypothetical protein
MEDFSVGGPCWWFDEKGILFERSVSAQGSIIKVINDYSRRDIRTGGKMISEEFITPLFSVLQVLSEAGISIKEIRLNDLDYQELQVETYDGPRLLFSLRFPPQGALAVLQNLEKRSDYGKMDYVDFRVENRAYFK